MNKSLFLSCRCRGASVTVLTVNRRNLGGGRLHSRRGFALVLVLCFVVLLTAVVLAYLSRSMLTAQVSNSSANQTRAALFAHGAADTIIGDLKQEIVAGSTTTTVTTGSVTSTFYTPVGSTNAAPFQVGTPSPQTVTIASGMATNYPLANLVKISTASAFYPGGGFRASSDANDLTTTPSLNGRYVSTARWNQSLLLPKKTPTSTTDFSPDPTLFTAPSWVLVARDGSNPGGSSSSLNLSGNGAAANNPAPINGVPNPSFVVGRYAYAIYNEGGMLDANVAGYPSSSSAAQSANKGGLAFADLRQLTDTAGNPLLTTANIDALVGWRNNASAQPTGAFPSYSFPAASTTNYFNTILGNNNGFMTTANTSLATSGASDQVFTSRQQLIDFFVNSLAESPNSSLQDLQNSLQYFGTFSRGLNQPSFAPDHKRPTIPKNDSAGLPNINTGYDDKFNPAFLSIRVMSPPFDRNAGANPALPVNMAVVGEPLVKKRFPLQRLAWLTYQGPSETRNVDNPSGTVDDSDYDIYALENKYGITKTFLKEGTAENIYKYFGLKWTAGSTGGYWTYNHGINGSTGLIVGYLSLIQAAGREPDFFELLKAGMTAGSLAKGATNPNGMLQTSPLSYAPKGTTEESSEYSYDTTLDYQILQIGANIIDQSTTDGYSTRIQFTNSAGLTEVRGVKNLPYFYRVRANTIISALPKQPPQAGNVVGGEYGTATGPDPYTVVEKIPNFKDTGCYAVLYLPEVWNPHAYNPNDVPDSVGSPRPTKLRILADTAELTPTGNAAKNVFYNAIYNKTFYDASNGMQSTKAAGPDMDLNNTGVIFYDAQYTDTAKMSQGNSFFTQASPPYTSTVPSANAGSTPASVVYVTWKGATAGYDTAMNFGDNKGVLFREPTILCKPNVPDGSGLALDSGSYISKLYTSTSLSSYWMPSQNGIVALNDLSSIGKAVPFIGFFCGVGPIRWVYTPPNPDPKSPPKSYVLTACSYQENVQDTLGNHGDTYRVQYQDQNGVWVTYDQKYCENLGAGNYLSTNASGAVDATTNRAVGGQQFWLGSVDPRTRRFGNPGGGDRGNLIAISTIPYGPSSSVSYPYPDPLNLPTQATPLSANASFFIDQKNNVISSDRWGASSGWGWWSTPTEGMAVVGGWYPAPQNNWMLSTNPSNPALQSLPPSAVYYRPGLLSQNNPVAITDGLTWANQVDAVSQEYFSDPDGVVRRAMGAYVPTSTSDPATTTVGLPMAVATDSSSPPNPLVQSQSRPIILNRPFRSVAELGYVFSDTPWRNLSMFTPESGAAALMDIFCIQPDDDPSPLVAGKVDLNTRQEPVLQAVLAGAYADEYLNETTPESKISPEVSIQGGAPATSEAGAIAYVLTGRTGDFSTPGRGPLGNISELVGKYRSDLNTAASAPLGGYDGAKSYSGFSGDLTGIYTSGSLADPNKNNIERYREAAVRSLSSVGTARVWNLLIDLVAQTGRFPRTATKYSDFVVDGEARYWLHVAIDRQTGQVIDSQLEVVKE
jgi:Tfp pilus assembly protein PilX